MDMTLFWFIAAVAGWAYAFHMWRLACRYYERLEELQGPPPENW